eukprot:c20648_g1_i2 orf=325-963(+)
MESPLAWLTPDESAKTMLTRVLARRSLSLTSVPPLHRVPLHAGHVLEVVGPSGSAKSELLLQAAVTCILPKQWDGVVYGGSQGAVVMFDLDCRFDMLRLVHVLQLRINKARGFGGVQANHGLSAKEEGLTQNAAQDEDGVFLDCLRRFWYTQCYNSFDFLAALKTVRARCKMLAEDGVNVQLLMIDSIGAFYWLDRSVSSTSSGILAGRIRG